MTQEESLEEVGFPLVMAWKTQLQRFPWACRERLQLSIARRQTPSDLQSEDLGRKADSWQPSLYFEDSVYVCFIYVYLYKGSKASFLSKPQSCSFRDAFPKALFFFSKNICWSWRTMLHNLAQCVQGPAPPTHPSALAVPVDAAGRLCCKICCCLCDWSYLTQTQPRSLVIVMRSLYFLSLNKRPAWFSIEPCLNAPSSRPALPALQNERGRSRKRRWFPCCQLWFVMCHEGRAQHLLRLGFVPANRSLHRAGNGRTAAAFTTAAFSRFPHQRKNYSPGSCRENTVFGKICCNLTNLIAWQTVTLSALPACPSWMAAGRAALTSCWSPDLPPRSPIISTSVVLFPGERACRAPFPLPFPRTPVCLLSVVFSLKPCCVLALKRSDSWNL